MMNKPSKDKLIAPQVSMPFKDELFSKMFPRLYWFISSIKYADGSIRMTGSVSVFTMQGSLRGSMNDRDNNRVTFVESETWDDLIAMMDGVVCNDNTVWKVSNPKKGEPPY